MAHTCHYYNAQSILSACQCIYSHIHTYVYTCMFARIWVWSPSSQNALWMAPPTQKAWSFHQATPARTGEFYIMHYMQAGWQCLIGIWDQHQIPYNVGHLIGEIRLVNIVKLNIQAIYTQNLCVVGMWMSTGTGCSHVSLSLVSSLLQHMYCRWKHHLCSECVWEEVGSVDCSSLAVCGRRCSVENEYCVSYT